MELRNRTWLASNEWLYDPLLLDPNDDRRCVAVVAEGIWKPMTDWEKLDDVLRNTLQDPQWLSPSLHHTFLCLRPWVNGRGSYDHENWDEVKRELQKELAGGYVVSFDRIIPVKTGITLCGTPDRDVNRVRQTVRDKGYVVGERYLLDIFHMTLLRNVAPLGLDAQACTLERWNDLAKGQFLQLHVKRLHICESSWLMRKKEFKIYATIPLENE